MSTRIALLRSVNVLGKNMIKMPELARAFETGRFQECQDIYPERECPL